MSVPSKTIANPQPATTSQAVEQTHHHGSSSMTLTGKGVAASWVISIGLHIFGLGIMVMLVFPFSPRNTADLPISNSEILTELPPTAFANSTEPTLTDQRTLEQPTKKFFDPKPTDSLSELTMTRKPDLAILGIGVSGSESSDFGLAVGGASGPQFFGLGGSAKGARNIVYVVDRSGSMIDTFVYVQRELKRSISALRRSQKFHVIYFNAGEPLENTPRKLVSAITAQKQSFYKFTDQVFPEGSTHPERAMQRALSLEPDLIYFLTDGEFDPQLIPKLDGWNRGRHTKIFTIAFVDAAGADLLDTIAREHGGKFRFVSENDLP